MSAKEAAEEIKNDAWLERFRKASVSNGYSEISCFTARTIASRVDSLIDKVLAEHPADDGEAVDNEFCGGELRGKPNHWQSGTIDWDIPCDDFEITIRVWNGHDLPDLILSNRGDSGNFQCQLSSRSQLRRLLAALGGERKEINHG